MSAVSNSSVLIALASIGQLQLLRERFPAGVLIPPAVWDEAVVTGAGRPGATEVSTAPGSAKVELRDRGLVAVLAAEVDGGESEAIALARQESAEAVLLDEREARRVAPRMGLSVLGTVGLLIWAKRAGLVTSLAAQLDALRTNDAFRLSHAVYENALRAAGER
ncbi:MAG: DUF3368 domain-containing protein [Chloroflexi bacterium]|nr:DUF3368 domain-containing protein [Chloroflexota bacterium]